MSALTDLFTSIANAIRTKTGSTASITASNFPTEIGNIENASDYISDTLTFNNTYGVMTLIKKLPKIKIETSPNQTTLANFFQRCQIQSIDLSLVNNVGAVSTMSNMFANCSQLTTIILSSDFNCKSVTNVISMFSGCSNLTTITGGGLKNLGQGYTNSTANYSAYRLDLSPTNLNHDSLMLIINNLYDLATAGKPQQTLRLGATLYGRLSASEIAIATGKGWNVTNS